MPSRVLLIVPALLLLAACSAKPLTASECQLISNQEIAFAVSHVPPEDAASFREHLEQRASAGNAACVAGKTYTRSEYKCMARAKNPAAIGKCIAAVGRRLGH